MLLFVMALIDSSEKLEVGIVVIKGLHVLIFSVFEPNRESLASCALQSHVFGGLVGHVSHVVLLFDYRMVQLFDHTFLEVALSLEHWVLNGVKEILGLKVNERRSIRRVDCESPTRWKFGKIFHWNPLPFLFGSFLNFLRLWFDLIKPSLWLWVFKDGKLYELVDLNLESFQVFVKVLLDKEKLLSLREVKWLRLILLSPQIPKVWVYFFWRLYHVSVPQQSRDILLDRWVLIENVVALQIDSLLEHTLQLRRSFRVLDVDFLNWDESL